MGTAYGISNCIAWFRAGVGVYSDAGTTPAVAGDGVYQWNDQSGAGNHLLQSTSANRPIYNDYGTRLTAAGDVSVSPFGSPLCSYRASSPSSIYFDGSNSFLNMPSGIALPNTGCTVLICSRGPSFCPISFATDAVNTLNYGWLGGGPGKMGINNSSQHLFPPATYLPTIAAMVHGFRCSAPLGETRLYMGTNQQAVIASNLCNFSMTGGAVGRTIGLSNGPYGHYSFLGEIYEIVVFSIPLSDSNISQLLLQMQSSNKIRSDANTNQVIFIGDSLTAGAPINVEMAHSYPYTLHEQMGGTFKPMQVAVLGQTIAQQQALVTSQVLPLDLSPFGKNVAVVCIGSNDIAAGRTDTQVVADLASLCTGLRSAGIKVILTTITPRTAGYTAGNITTLASVNTSLRSVYNTFADALVDWAADARLSDCSNTIYYFDQVHTTDAGDTVKAELVKAALDPMLSSGSSVLSYASFYSAGRTFAGNFGNFVRS